MPKLLIVEDEAIIAADLAEMAEEWGWSIVGSASNAKQAIQLAQDHKPDVAVVDINLQRNKPTGIDVAAVLQGELSILVVYLSGLSDEKLHPAVAFSHPFAYLEKPFDPPYLRRILERALRGPGMMSGSID